MVDVGLLDTEINWKWTSYSINKNGVKEINKFFETLAEKQYLKWVHLASKARKHLDEEYIKDTFFVSYNQKKCQKAP